MKFDCKAKTKKESITFRRRTKYAKKNHIKRKRRNLYMHVNKSKETNIETKVTLK
jgi:hypothetical protein